MDALSGVGDEAEFYQQQHGIAYHYRRKMTAKEMEGLPLPPSAVKAYSGVGMIDLPNAPDRSKK